MRKNSKEEIRLKRQSFICLLVAMLLVILAIPAFAEPTEPTTVIPAVDETFDSELPLDPEATLPEGETEEQPMLIYTTEPTTIGFVPINEDIMPYDGELLTGAPEDGGYLSQRNLTFGALGLGGLALLLSVIALARTRRKTAPNATGNYQKYF
jgi:hypothetical protein